MALSLVVADTVLSRGCSPVKFLKQLLQVFGISRIKGGLDIFMEPFFICITVCGIMFILMIVIICIYPGRLGRGRDRVGSGRQRVQGVNTDMEEEENLMQEEELM